MPQYKFYITQTNHFELLIQAKSEEEAITFFNEDYITEDFGNPVNSDIRWDVFDVSDN
jgi:hypothetical protein